MTRRLDPRTPLDDVGKLVDRIKKLEGRLDALSTPTGTQRYQAVSKLQALVANIQQQLNDYIANGTYNKSQLDQMFAGKANSSHTHDAGDIVSGTVARPVNTSGAVSGGSVASSGDLRGATLYATGAPGYNISGTRVAAWWESATGRAGTASSSERYKTNIEPANLSTQAILAMQVVHYNYKAEVARRDDPASSDYVGPDYKVATEVGVIAERLHELGLWQFVVYQRENYTEERTRPAMLERVLYDADTNEPILDDDGNPVVETYEGEETYTLYLDRLKLDESGQPIPDGVHYELLGLALLPVIQAQEKRLVKVETALARLNVGL